MDLCDVGVEDVLMGEVEGLGRFKEVIFSLILLGLGKEGCLGSFFGGGDG